ncbi:MAG TPA: penicillin-binding transpeptidase domain-containing protein [Candidatus Paceibacterota bacterium]|nr:penicillin-binding transpeptidase domain-containing protein [Candidatus Paceibacterota bacterium]
MVWRRRNKKIKVDELNPDEIIMDVHNLPSFDRQQFEGQIERPISKRSLSALSIILFLIAGVFVFRLAYIQIAKYDFYTQKSEQNSFDAIPLFADRGVIYDRYSTELVWNSRDEQNQITRRSYTDAHGFASLLGYVSYPAKDEKGKFWQEKTIGKDGVEKEFDATLSGENGKKLVESDVGGNIISEGAVEFPIPGENIYLSVDSRIQEALYGGIKSLAERSGYVGGTGIVMDIYTGELYAMTSYPEYNSEIISEGLDKATINNYLKSSSKPLLNRAIDGVYTPGSIVKPFFALAALQEEIISPNKVIFTNGKLEIPNPYNPKLKTIFRDNADHGPVDMREALAVSSNVYFYQISGGFGEQKGLGIANLEKYSKMFGLGQKTGVNLSGEREGNIPSIEWKAKRFPGDPWRVGDTYNTSIGQYGFQVTPIQMARAIGAVASRGLLQTPTILKDERKKDDVALSIKDSAFDVVHEGMRRAVLEGSTTALNNDVVHVAAKSGTAQIKNNTRVNSSVEGFFPYENPKFAFVVLMEDGPKVSSGAVHAFRPVIDLFISDPSLLN